MKHFLLLLLLSLSFIGFSQRSALSPNIRKLKNDTIIWKPDSLLKKEDFKSRPKAGALGLSYVGIFLYPGESGGEFLYYVEALFVKSKSYITKYSEYVLKHEQIHFDICELYARKMRQKISETNFKKVKNVMKEIQGLYDKVSSEQNKEQSKYDNDTEHGLNSVKQKVWEEDIHKRIAELDAFSSTAVSLKN